jgi:hypothetical protein
LFLSPSSHLSIFSASARGHPLSLLCCISNLIVVNYQHFKKQDIKQKEVIFIALTQLKFPRGGGEGEEGEGEGGGEEKYILCTEDGYKEERNGEGILGQLTTVFKGAEQMRT